MGIKINNNSSGFERGNDSGIHQTNIMPSEGFDSLMGQNLYMDYIREGKSTEADKTIMCFQIFSETATISGIEFKKGYEWEDIADIYDGVELAASSLFYGEYKNITVNSGIIIVYYKK